MDYKQALEYINGVSWRTSKPGLERVTELLRRLGNPQAELRYVHVAGTNGKGSISAMLASVLKKAGLTVGLYTSPYVNRFNERMQINGKSIEDNEVAELVAEMKTHADAMDDHPTEFEMMTAVAFMWFCRRKCDIVVLEVGMGGRLDATNVIACPDCCVIANIGLDHTAVLGGTLEEIAYEKAGIIKEGSPVVMYQQYGEVMEVVRDVCAERNAELTVPDFDDIHPEFDSRDGQVFSAIFDIGSWWVLFAGIGMVFADQVGHAGGGDNAQQLYVSADTAQAGGQGGFQHIAGHTGIFADQDFGAVAVQAAYRHRIINQPN